MINGNSNKYEIIRRKLNGIYNWKIFDPIRKYLDLLKVKIEQSIRFELMVVIAICFIGSTIFYAFSNDFLKHENEEARVVYNYEGIETTAQNYVSQIENAGENITLKDTDFFTKLVDGIYEYGAKAYVTDLDGKVFYKSPNVEEDKIDIFTVLTKSASKVDDENKGNEKKYIFPISVGEERSYFIYSDIPSAKLEYYTYEVSNSFLALVLTVIVFIVIFIFITNNKMKYLDEIAIGLRTIANGDLGYRIKEEGRDEIRNIASNINNMAEEINKKIEAERRAEQTKTDLITNVSHDLRTPLTSIMGYIGLVNEGKYNDEKKMKEYLDIAFNKSEKLKILIEDLFEYAKLNNCELKLNKTEVNMTEFIFQLTEELMPLFEENNLSIIKTSTEEKVMVNLDIDKMLRVFENLFTNATKYSFKPGKIVIGVNKSNDYAIVAIRNKGEHIPKEKIEKLFDRFYRVEESRNTLTGGTGLGLAISKSIVELHEGKIWAESYGEDISFYVKLKTIEN